MQAHAAIARRAAQQGAELGIVGFLHRREARPEFLVIGATSGLKGSRLMWSVSIIRAARPGSGRSEPAALVANRISQPISLSVRTGRR